MPDLSTDDLPATTRSVRRRLGLTRPVPREVIERGRLEFHAGTAFAWIGKCMDHGASIERGRDGGTSWPPSQSVHPSRAVSDRLHALGTDFKPAYRKPLAEVLGWNGFTSIIRSAGVAT